MSDKSPHVMSFEASLVGAEDYKFKNGKRSVRLRKTSVV